MRPSELARVLGAEGADIARLGLIGLREGVELDPLAVVADHAAGAGRAAAAGADGSGVAAGG